MQIERAYLVLCPAIVLQGLPLRRAAAGTNVTEVQTVNCGTSQTPHAHTIRYSGGRSYGYIN